MNKILKTHKLDYDSVMRTYSDFYNVLIDIIKNELHVPGLINMVAQSDLDLIEEDYQKAPFFQKSMTNCLENLMAALSPCKMKKVTSCFKYTLENHKYMKIWIENNTSIDRRTKTLRIKDDIKNKMIKNLELLNKGKVPKVLSGPDYNTGWFDSILYSEITEGFDNLFGDKIDVLLCTNEFSELNSKLKTELGKSDILGFCLNLWRSQKKWVGNFKLFKTSFLKFFLIFMSSVANLPEHSHKMNLLIEDIINFLNEEEIKPQIKDILPNFESKLSYLRKRELKEVLEKEEDQNDLVMNEKKIAKIK